MKSFVIALCAAAMLAASPASRGRAETAQPRAFADLRTAMAAFDREDCKAALIAVNRARASADFQALETILRLAALQLAAICESREGQKDRAYKDALAATAFPESDDFMWRMRLALELDAKRHDAAVATMEAMANGRGAALNAIPITWYYQFDTQLKGADALALRRRLLALLASDAFAPADPGVDNQGFKSRYASLLYEAGQRDAAVGIVRTIDNPSLLIDLSLDPRFRAAFPADPDIRSAVERRLEEARLVVARNPDHIGPVNDIATYLRALGRPKEALAALEAIRASVVGDAPLADRDDQAIWWWDQLSRAHQMAGDYEPAVAALAKGGSLGENGGANVSQVINLSQVQLEFGKTREALATIAAFDGDKRGTSPFGQMQVVTTRACARFRLGRAGEIAADLSFARAHATDAPDALTRLLLCISDEDAAAASMIARLADTEQRAGALRDLSTFDDPPVTLPPDPVRDGYAALRKRADVRAAADKAGGTRRFRVQDISF